MGKVLCLDTCQARHQKSCYQVVTDTKTWADAATNCQSLGGHLAVIESLYENDIIQKLLIGKFSLNSKTFYKVIDIAKY